MKIVLATFGSRGDVQPMLALALGLKAKGHEPVLCAPENFKEWIESFAIPFQPSGLDIQSWMFENAEYMTERSPKSFQALTAVLRSQLPGQFESVLAASQGAGLLIGASLQFAGFSVAEYLNIPYLYIAYCPRLFLSDYHPPQMIQTPKLPVWLNRQLWKMEYWLWHYMVLDIVNQYREKWELSILDDILHDNRLLTEHTILAAYPELAPLPPDIKDQYRQVSTLHLPSSEPLDEGVLNFLSSGSPPIYVGFGSMTDKSSSATTQMIFNLANQYGLRFLIDKGWAGLGAKELPLGIEVVEKASHDLLFPHVAAVIHHGGAGTTATAARAGVPQIIVPHLLDQYYWGNQIYTLGLGPEPMPKAQVTEGYLKSAIFQILEQEHYSQRAKDLGQILRPKNGVEEAISLLFG